MDEFDTYPAGLLEMLGIDREKMRQQQRTQGLLSAGLQLLAGSGYSPVRRTLGELAGQAGAAGLQGYQQAGESSIDRALKGMQVKQMMDKQKREQEFNQAIRNAYRMTPSAQGVMDTQTNIDPALLEGMSAEQVIAAAPKTERVLDQQKFMAALAEYNPLEYAKMMATEQKGAPGVVGEYEAAIARGFIPRGTTLDQYIAMKKPPAPSATAIAGGKLDPFTEASQKKQAEVFSNLQESGAAASRTLRSVNTLESLLSKVDTGAVASFQQIAGNFGIPSKGLSNIQAAQAIINKLVPQQRPPGSGTMSDADLILYKESLPRIINQPNGNMLIIQSIKDINNYVVQEGKIASDVLDGKITPAEGRQKLLELGNPIQDFFAQNPGLASPTGATNVAPSERALIDKYRKQGSPR